MSARERIRSNGMVSTNRHAMITPKMFWGRPMTLHLAAESLSRTCSPSRSLKRDWADEARRLGRSP
jgi:hypothetical protein